MEIERSALMKALNALRPAYKSSSAGNDLVTYFSEDRMLMAHSDEIIIRFPLDLGERNVAFNADKVLALLSRLESKTVQVDVGDSELLLKTKTVQSGVPTRDFEEHQNFHQTTFPLEDRMEDVTEDFVNGLKFTVGSCAKDMAVPVLTCVQIKADAMLSCDQYRASWWSMKQKVEALNSNKEVLLPASSVNKALDYELKKVAFDDQWVHFVSSDGALLSCYSYAEEIPDLTSLFDVGEDYFVMEWPKEVLSSLKRAELFTDPESKTAKVTINKGLMRIQSHSDEGWYEEKIAATVKDDRKVKTSFSISLTHLQEVLTRNVPIIIGDKRVMFEGPNWKHVIATYYVED